MMTVVSDATLNLLSVSHLLSEPDGELRRLKFDLTKEPRQCEKHGEYIASCFRNVWSMCEKCKDDIDREKEVERSRLEKEERKATLWKQRLGRAAIPERFTDRTLENYIATCEQSKNALSIAKTYADNFKTVLELGSSLSFLGNVGTGKTHLAIGIANEILKQGKQPVFISVMKAIRSIKETYSRDVKTTEDEAIQRFIEPDLLILDEVGVQFGSETEKLYLFEIINGRYERRKPTILISNLDKLEFEKFIGVRVMDRLREGGGKMIAFNWKSYRSSV
jgi:DNA replication protein DnaC